jgi:hypothetical protein
MTVAQFSHSLYSDVIESVIRQKDPAISETETSQLLKTVHDLTSELDKSRKIEKSQLNQSF